ncbi:MAG: hypothetical protein KJ048_12650 [Dehalococcoidia bacterium]|nr:hypothetical protein [Dehalococcoidia bacterium]
MAYATTEASVAHEENGTMSTSTPPSLEFGAPGEFWGDFIFVDPGAPARYTVTPAPAKGFDPRGIPDSHPGTRVFGSLPELLGLARVSPDDIEFPSYLPPGYEFIGGYVVLSEEEEVVHLVLAFRPGPVRLDSGPLPEVFNAVNLTVGWSKWVDSPLPVPTTGESADLGRVAKPTAKVTVRGFAGVYREWENPPGIDPSLALHSSLRWFDDARRMWFVMAPAPFAELARIAETLGPATIR